MIARTSNNRMMNTSAGTALVLLATSALATLAIACNPTPSQGRFKAEQLIYGQCGEDILPFEPEFFTVNQFENIVTIRLQSRAGAVQALDGLFIQVDRDFISSRIGEEVLLGMPDEAGQIRVRALMGFYESCPASEVVPELVGTITFSYFEPVNDGQISAQIHAPTVIDSRSGNIIGLNMTGYFSFLHQNGRPYTNFTGPSGE